MRARLSCTRLTVAVTALLLVAAAAAPTVHDDLPATGSTAALALAPLPASGDGATATVAAPDVVPRSSWDPAGGCPAGDGKRTVPERIHLHHTHVPVVAAPEEVPGALQAICRAHRQRGFDEIGYHSAVDPFGQVWQGRGPLPDDAGGKVRTGAHAQGFNDGSVGVVLIGDFDVAPPTDAALDATTELLAWLVDAHDLDPHATVGAESTGGPATRFDEGAHVDLPAIAGHRDTGSGTSCPGEHLYALLPELRDRVAERVAAA